MDSKRFSFINMIMITVLLAMVIVVASMFGYRRYQRVQIEKERLRGKIVSEKAQTDDLRQFEYFALEAMQNRQAKISAKEHDLFTLEDEVFDEIQLSMWNTGMLDKEWYYTYFAKNIFYPEYYIETPQDMKDCFDAISMSENKPKTIYINIDPYSLSQNYYEYEYYNIDAMSYEEYVSEAILTHVENNPDIDFIIFFPVKSVTYWSELSKEAFDLYFDSWYRFLMYLRWWPNIHVSYMGDEEWLICNDDNFVSENVLNDELSRQIYIYLYGFPEYRITPPELEQSKNNLYQIIENKIKGDYYYPGLDGKEVVFFGDSIFAHCDASSISVSGYLRGMSDATVIDMSVGGTTASYYLENSFPEITSTLREGEFTNPSFAVLYGFNDYFCGVTLEEFEKGLIKGISNIGAVYPTADITLLTPYFTVLGNGGSEPFDEDGATLDEYIDVIEEVSNEYGIKCINLYDLLDITFENENKFLVDGVHPKYGLALEISRLLAKNLADG